MVRIMSPRPIALSLEELQRGDCAQQISQCRAAGIGDGFVAEEAGGRCENEKERKRKRGSYFSVLSVGWLASACAMGCTPASLS
jgi:hypothetical protein